MGCGRNDEVWDEAEGMDWRLGLADGVEEDCWGDIADEIVSEDFDDEDVPCDLLTEAIIRALYVSMSDGSASEGAASYYRSLYSAEKERAASFLG